MKRKYRLVALFGHLCHYCCCCCWISGLFPILNTLYRKDQWTNYLFEKHYNLIACLSIFLGKYLLWPLKTGDKSVSGKFLMRASISFLSFADSFFFMVFILSQVSLHICYNHLYFGAYFYKIVVFCWIFFIFWYFFSHSTHICYNHLRLCPASIWINVVISINTVSPFFQISIFWHSFNCVCWICNDN